MISKDLESYVTVFQGAIPQEVCRQTCEELDKVDWIQHNFYNVKTNSYHSTEKELSVFFDKVSTKPFLMQLEHQLLTQYVKDLNFPWFDGWAGFSEIRFNRYAEQTNMKLHCDHIHSMFDGEMKGIPTMTFLAILNDDYEGGEFIMFDNKEIKFKTGSAVVFPSVFLFPHKVLPVTKGTRHSCVSWAW